MNIDEHIKEYQRRIEVMQAAEEGKGLEYKVRAFGDWLECNSPIWDWDECDYRVKPKPREVWVNCYNGYMYGPYLSKDVANRNAMPGPGRECIHFREVIE